MIRREYCLHLNSEHGQTSVSVNVRDTGEIDLKFSLARDGEDENDTFSLSFKSDADIKGLIELLRWSRVASLKAQGYQVVM